MTRRLAWTSLLFLLLVPTGGRAHDLWIEPTADGLVLFRGHAHSDHTHADGGGNGYDLAEVGCATFRDAEGQVRPCGPVASVPVRFPADCEAAFGQLRSGPWTQTPQGTRQVPPSAVERPLRSWLAVENVKFLAVWRAPGRALTEHLELSLTRDLLGLDVGDKVRLRLTRCGEPVAGAVVCYAGEPRGTTDRQGEINIRLREPGLQMIQSTVRLSATDPELDDEVHTTTLNFVLEPE